MGFLDRITPDDLENAKGFSSFSIGDNLAKITEVKESTSTSGNDMLVITFSNESGAKINYYIVEGEFKLQKLKSLYQAFGIPFSEKNYQRWIGKKGIVVCKEGRPYNGAVRSEVNYVRPILNGSAPAPQQYGKPPVETLPPPDDRFDNDLSDDFSDDIPF
jgi:hypothetical protein